MNNFTLTSVFIESLKKLDVTIQKKIKEKLPFLSNVENPLSFAKKLQGHKNIFRFRCGDYRIVFSFSKKEIVLLMVKHRKDIYEGL
jgi:mRNA-degrading endonuclease RelE of RelBE toxin-antitoxin system